MANEGLYHMLPAEVKLKLDLAYPRRRIYVADYCGAGHHHTALIGHPGRNRHDPPRYRFECSHYWSQGEAEDIAAELPACAARDIARDQAYVLRRLELCDGWKGFAPPMVLRILLQMIERGEWAGQEGRHLTVANAALLMGVRYDAADEAARELAGRGAIRVDRDGSLIPRRRL